MGPCSDAYFITDSGTIIVGPSETLERNSIMGMATWAHRSCLHTRWSSLWDRKAGILKSYH